jgi:hypothetical protein
MSHRSNIQEDVMAPRAVFLPAPTPQSARPPSQRSVNEVPEVPPRFGIAGIAQVADVNANVRRGRDFAFDNCRPCHVVAPNQRSTTRFSNAPDFQSVANNMPSTTPFSLIVWLTNPHPTMPFPRSFASGGGGRDCVYRKASVRRANEASMPVVSEKCIDRGGRLGRQAQSAFLFGFSFANSGEQVNQRPIGLM